MQANFSMKKNRLEYSYRTLCRSRQPVYKYSDALCTTLVTKDRVLGHNPAAALYQINSYYSKLLDVEEDKQEK